MRQPRVVGSAFQRMFGRFGACDGDHLKLSPARDQADVVVYDGRYVFIMPGSIDRRRLSDSPRTLAAV
jgi:hypothetical protein